ncbi:MAG: GIY-YIG nuclease family protein [Candidatus Omnitrophica bacterium]|nr:GIY-YIG nuclease family protein [Candidatus Omnitrophota bacterium]
MIDKRGYVYILTNKNDKVLYVGITSDLIKRVYEHKTDLVEGFTRKYKTHKLVYYEIFEDIKRFFGPSGLRMTSRDTYQ